MAAKLTNCKTFDDLKTAIYHSDKKYSGRGKLRVQTTGIARDFIETPVKISCQQGVNNSRLAIKNIRRRKTTLVANLKDHRGGQLIGRIGRLVHIERIDPIRPEKRV